MKILKNRRFSMRTNLFAISIAFASYIAVNYGFAIDLFSMVVSDMKREIGFDYTTAGTIAAFVRAGFLVASLSTMFIIPLIGAGRLVILSVVVCTSCSWAMAFAHSVWLIGSIMTLIGACAATVYIPMVEIVGRFIQKKYHGRVIGFICGGQSLGVIGASFMVPYFITHQTWRWAWMAVGGIGVIVVGITVLVLDQIGVFKIDHSDDENHSSRAGSPLHDIRSVLTRGTLFVLILYFFSAFSYNPFQTYLSAYLRDELGFSVDTASMVWSCIAVPGIISGFVMGYLADRLSIGFSLIVAYLATFVATLVLLFINTVTYY